MKKIALCSLLVCLGSGFAYGANQCKTSITFTPAHNNWNAGSNEYLFETKRDYLSAVNSGYVYECDSNWCPNNSYVEVESGHVFQDRTIHEKAFYKCSTSWNNDKWEKVSDVQGLTKCTKQWYWKSDFGIDKWLQDKTADEYLYPTVSDWDAINSRVYSQVYECDSSVCADGTIITLPAGHVFGREDINKERKYKCVLGTPGDDKWVDITDDCEDCDEKAPSKPVTDPKTPPKSSPKPIKPVTPDPVVPGNCEYHFQGTVYCANGNSMNIDKIYPVSEKVLNGKSCSEFNKMYENDLSIVLAYFDELCDGASLAPLGPSNSEVSAATEKLTTFFKSAEANRSGLKTADGKFNTVRLASDLTAGVVLGTVGGVVSGVVIKKKQVEKGFDALHCTVGGQTTMRILSETDL